MRFAVHDLAIVPIPARASASDASQSDEGHLVDSDGDHFALITACGDSSVISRLDGWLTSWVMSWETIASKTPNGSINVWPIKLSHLRLLAGGSSSVASALPVSSTASPPSNSRISSHASYPRKSFCHHTEHQGTALSVDSNTGCVWIGASDGSIVQYQLYCKRVTLDAAEDCPSADAAVAPAPLTSPGNHSIDINLLRHSFNLPHANRDWLGQLFYNAHQRELLAVSNDMITTVCLRRALQKYPSLLQFFQHVSYHFVSNLRL